MLRATLMILCMLILAACGKGKDSSAKQVTRITQEQIDTLMSNQKFECASINKEKCPVGISRIFILDIENADNSAVCSAFLAGSNKIVTNQHCLSTETQCRSTYVSIYTGKGYISARCKEIIATKEDSTTLSTRGVDYTVFELDQDVVQIDPMRVSDKYIQVGQMLTAWVVDQVDLFKARITQIDCNYKENRSSMVLGNCPIIHGNSGSPLMNADGDVVGLIWGTTISDSFNAQTPLELRMSQQSDGLATKAAHFINYL